MINRVGNVYFHSTVFDADCAMRRRRINDSTLLLGTFMADREWFRQRGDLSAVAHLDEIIGEHTNPKGAA